MLLVGGIAPSPGEPPRQVLLQRDGCHPRPESHRLRGDGLCAPCAAASLTFVSRDPTVAFPRGHAMRDITTG